MDAVMEGSFHPRAKRIILAASCARDLSLRIIKTGTTGLAIPSLQFEVPEGRGRYTTVADLLIDARDDIESTAFGARSSAFLDALSEIINGTKEARIVFEDPLGNVEVEKEASHPRIAVEWFDRSWADSKEYGLVPYYAEEQHVGDEGIDKLVELIQGANHIVGLTGAGVSTESGIPAFRVPMAGDAPVQSSWWARHDPKDAELASFLADTDSRKRFWAMKADLMEIIGGAQPNAAHTFWSKVHSMGKLDALITQNIDGLHAQAGVPAASLIELHGTLRTVHCMTCAGSAEPDTLYAEVRAQAGALDPHCACGGLLKPDLVSFGQAIAGEVLSRAMQAVKQCDLLIVVGTSLLVEPANLLPGMALANHAPLAIVNQGPTKYDDDATVLLSERPCGQIFETLGDALGGSHIPM
eukprot:TRINITY_DN16751_c0_g1_i1.p1 TRINITY_DN16751_c0_g1~~TRINITY_DN16751_c0_g1_i1.p1  ORF type:complete len:422 (-),score=90.37 TRINITY_DN16751_c0_g1_i1:59-1294(-)